MNKILCTLIMFGLASCTQLNSLEITAEDNAMACIKGNTSATSGVLGGNISGITVELPAGTDTSNWTAADWKELAELCDQQLDNPMIIEFPDTKVDHQIEDAMEQLGNWVESQIDLGISPIILIGLMETYKSALTNNLLIDEED